MSRPKGSKNKPKDNQAQIAVTKQAAKPTTGKKAETAKKACVLPPNPVIEKPKGGEKHPLLVFVEWAEINLKAEDYAYYAKYAKKLDEPFKRSLAKTIVGMLGIRTDRIDYATFE